MNRLAQDTVGLSRILTNLLVVNQKIFRCGDSFPNNLSNISGKLSVWKTTRRGIYVFLRHDFDRQAPIHSQVIRVGTHGIKKGGSKSTLWGRLRQHKGNVRNGGGNHRGSIFRLLVGDAIIQRDGLRSNYPNCEVKRNASAAIRQSELPLEKQVSNYIRRLPFLVVNLDPAEDGPEQRAYVERNLIAMISRIGVTQKPNWLGLCCSRTEVRKSGLWNNNHVNEEYDSTFLSILQKYVHEMDEQ